MFTINKNDLSYGRGYVYSLQYHLVWCTKYRKKVLKDGIDVECKEMLQGLAQEYKFQILAMEVMPDHVHLLIDCRPYAPGAFYCRLKEVGDDCCGIQCEYVNSEGEIETGALKHGDYFFNHRKVYQYLSPLYKAKIVSKDELDWDDYVKEKRKC